MKNTRMISTIKTIAAASATALLLGACASNDVEQLANAQMTGNEYRDKLAANYAELAKYEDKEMYDMSSATFFAKKGMDALKGKNIVPEDPNKWGVSNKEMLSDLQGARAQLLTSLNKGAAEKLPSAAARAMVSYDCWVEQSEEGWQYKDIAGCRDKFNTAMATIDKGMVPVVAAEPAPAPAPAVAKVAPTPTQYLVFFDWDSAKLTSAARDIIRSAADNARRANIVSFELVGHADRSGPADYNQRLSVRRANAIADALVEMGYSKGNIALTGRGESDPLVQTGDNVREPQNRRVLLTIANRRVGA